MLGTEKIDYKVEQERFLARAVRKRRGQSGDKRGTNFSNPSKPDAPVSKDGDEDSKPRRRKGGKSMLSQNAENKKIISEKKIRFDATNEALEVTEEDDGKKKKKGARRKKKDKEEDKMR